MTGGGRRQTRTGNAAFGCGLASLVLAPIPYLNVLAPIAAVVATTLGLAGLFRGQARYGRNLVAIATGAATLAIFGAVTAHYHREFEALTIDAAEYGRIRTGMTVAQVDAIVGSPGRPTYVPLVAVVYQGRAWRGAEPGTGAIVAFLDGKAFAKEQRGLQ